MAFSIIPAKEIDLDRILALFENTIREVCRKDYSPEAIEAWTASVNDREKWIGKIRNQVFLLAEAEGSLAGFGSLELPGYIDVLYTDALRQKSGVGKALLKELEQKALKSGALMFSTHASITARPFFEHQGYQEVRKQTVMRDGISLTNFIMEKPTSLLSDHLVFFDGYCVLCNGLVDFLLKRDKNKIFRFASLQGKTAAHIPSIQEAGKESVIYLRKGTAFTESSAVLAMFQTMGGFWIMIGIFYLIPRFIRDSLYRFIAGKRYGWFGKNENCRIPSEKEKERILP